MKIPRKCNAKNVREMFVLHVILLGTTIKVAANHRMRCIKIGYLRRMLINVRNVKLP